MEEFKIVRKPFLASVRRCVIGRNSGIGLSKKVMSGCLYEELFGIKYNLVFIDVQSQTCFHMRLYKSKVCNSLDQASRVSDKASKNWFNTLRPRQNGRHFADDIFTCIFLNENA